MKKGNSKKYTSYPAKKSAPKKQVSPKRKMAKPKKKKWNEKSKKETAQQMGLVRLSKILQIN